MRSHDNHRQVKRRRVFYIPGYDPIHPRRYRELYRTESAAQAAISGYEITLSPRTGDGPYGWHVRSVQDGTAVEAEFQVLVWSDIVRDSMSNSIAATYGQLIRTAWVYISTGVLWRLMKLRKGPVIAAIYPVAMLLIQLGVAVGAALGIWALLSSILGWVACLPATALGYAVLRWFRKIDNHLFAYYLMHDYAHSAACRGRTPLALQQRLCEFASLVDAALKDDVDEVLVVGHSSGAHLGVAVLAELIRSALPDRDGPTLSFLSLGQVVPMVSFLPDATDLRADLQFLSQQEGVTWVDVSAPGDGCAFALCDPVSVTGVRTDAKKWPLVLSAAFTQTLSPERWRQLRWRFFRLHFQYLCAFDRVGAYDYFRVTAGPLTLGARFGGRAPSKSRIDTPVSKYRSVVG
ncbi:hypothetical protein [Ruegeria lacuscaerulensis]|uniref:hypothetical protein n=1 Tax=Ruegeria lacuscaerulensis TaxID=55218 RepID=UPI00147F8F87|nr:hypothetical protein [Ruegeria lacuscaerulensis]